MLLLHLFMLCTFAVHVVITPVTCADIVISAAILCLRHHHDRCVASCLFVCMRMPVTALLFYVRSHSRFGCLFFPRCGQSCKVVEGS